VSELPEYDDLTAKMPELYQYLSSNTGTPWEGITLMTVLTAAMLERHEFDQEDKLRVVELFLKLLKINFKIVEVEEENVRLH
jgi:hypothetical protein